MKFRFKVETLALDSIDNLFYVAPNEEGVKKVILLREKISSLITLVFNHQYGLQAFRLIVWLSIKLSLDTMLSMETTLRERTLMIIISIVKIPIVLLVSLSILE